MPATGRKLFTGKLHRNIGCIILSTEEKEKMMQMKFYVDEGSRVRKKDEKNVEKAYSYMEKYPVFQDNSAFQRVIFFRVFD